MRIVIDTDSKALYKDEYGCLVPFTALVESEQNEICNALLDEVAKHNLCSRTESVEEITKNMHRLIKSRIGVISDTEDDTEDENIYKFCTRFNDRITIGVVCDTYLETNITTNITQYTLKQYRV